MEEDQDQEIEPDGLTINFVDGLTQNYIYFIISIILFGINLFMGK